MTTARVISEADIVPHRAAGYRLVTGELQNQEWVSPALEHDRRWLAVPVAAAISSRGTAGCAPERY